MATITLKSVVPGKALDPQAIVTFQIQTSMGRQTLTFSLNDQGGHAQNEREALGMLDIFLRESLDALEFAGHDVAAPKNLCRIKLAVGQEWKVPDGLWEPPVGLLRERL